jgi:CheY-like chemotaxis protein
MTRPTQPRVVVINDNPDFLDLMGDLLHDERYPVTLIDGDRPNTLELIEAALPQALIIDLRLGSDELHGWDVLKQVRSHATLSRLPTIVCSADIDALATVERESRDHGRTAVLRKPFRHRRPVRHARRGAQGCATRLTTSGRLRWWPSPVVRMGHGFRNEWPDRKVLCKVGWVECGARR